MLRLAASADALCLGTYFSLIKYQPMERGLPVLQIGTELETPQRMR